MHGEHWVRYINLGRVVVELVVGWRPFQLFSLFFLGYHRIVLYPHEYRRSLIDFLNDNPPRRSG